MQKAAHPKSDGIVSNKEGTGHLHVLDKKNGNDFIVVVSEDAKLKSYRSGKGDGDGLTPDCGGKFDDLKDMMDNRPLDFLAIDRIFIGEIGTEASMAQLESSYGTHDKSVVVRTILKVSFWVLQSLDGYSITGVNNSSFSPFHFLFSSFAGGQVSLSAQMVRKDTLV